MGVDGISLFLVVLTVFLTPLSLLSSWASLHGRVRAFSICMLVLESAMIGVFVSMNLFLFYVFWDAMLVPMYILIGVYLLVYALTNVAAFGVIALVGTGNRANDDLDDFAGLWSRQPVLAGLMTVLLLSLGGFPPTAGFIAKWYIFSAAISAGYTGLAVIGVLTSVVSVFFYLRIVVMMYMVERPAGGAVLSTPGPLTMTALAVLVLIIFCMGILPTPLLDLAAASVGTIY